MKEHKCKTISEKIRIIINDGDFSKYKWHYIIINDRDAIKKKYNGYVIQIKYCPFCGVKLE